MDLQSELVLDIQKLEAYFGEHRVVHGIDMKIYTNTVTAIIGPSGCGKSTFIRCLNRLHEEVLGASAKGKVFLKDVDLYQEDPVMIRRQIGMVFQKPNPFPGMSIYENVVAGLKLAGVKRKSFLMEIAEKSLKAAALWDEVKDKLHSPATSLSGGQQQRLCIARTLAIDPPVLLMDEPTSALDPISTLKIEELIFNLKKQITIVIVTHNMQQAARVSDFTAFFLLGELVEFDETSKVFTVPKDKRTEQYVTGKFG